MGKRTKQLTCVILFATLATSCSVTSKTYRTENRKVSVKTSVQQMPVLAELDLDSTRVIIDSCWTDSLFHQTFSIQKQVANLMAKALDQYKADVFVMPDYTWKKQHVGFLKTEHSLSVNGFLGKYKSFRTATRDDIKEYNLFRYEQSDSLFQSPLTAIIIDADDMTKKPAYRTKRMSNSYEGRKKGFAWGFEYSLGCRGWGSWEYKEGNNPDKSFHEKGDWTYTGYPSWANIYLKFGAMVHPNIYLGGGVGFKYMEGKSIKTFKGRTWHKAIYSNSGKLIRSGYYSDDYSTTSANDNHGAPLFFEARFFMLDKFCTPTIGLKIGPHFAECCGLFVQANLCVAIGVFDIGVYFDAFTPFQKEETPLHQQLQVGPIIQFQF